MGDKNNQYLHAVTVFQGRRLPQHASFMVGYGALIQTHALRVPLPRRLALISKRHRRGVENQWRIFTPRHRPDDDLRGHLIFALRHEGIDLLVLKRLFEALPREEVEQLVKKEPTSRHGRRIWFLYEWLMGRELRLKKITRGNYVDLVDGKIQYTGPARNSPRQRVRNNLPGTPEFCPMIRRTKKLEAWIASNMRERVKLVLAKVSSDIIARASAFLMLEDSKSSFAIEGERPPAQRAHRWGQTLGQAGRRPLSAGELLRLQQQVIGDDRFTRLGWREEGGFVGSHDRSNGAPLPEHISARWEDLESLIRGLIETQSKLDSESHDPVLTACVISFGFVFMHPFADGNGRVHRYLIHHVLADKGMTGQGLIFPVSSVFLENIAEYRRVLESFSAPRLEHIEWSATEEGNVEVHNETADLYRYFDATDQAEYLYACVERTVEDILPNEVKYLERYDRMKAAVSACVEMPDRQADLLIRFLSQNQGILSRRARDNEFSKLTKKEIQDLEKAYRETFN